MKEFDYVIIGGGCAGLSLAYELDIHNKLDERTLAIIEPRETYKRDKTWSFWKVNQHNFEDCIKNRWKEFSINTKSGSKIIKCGKFPYESIDSGLFYDKIITRLKKNKNIKFFKDTKDLDLSNSFIFNSLPSLKEDINSNIRQHFYGVEIETKEEFFNESLVNLMDFNCDQRNNVHFFYVLPFSKNKAMVETTWLSKKDNSLKDYNAQIEIYLNNLGIKDYKINYKEEGSIPLFYPINEKEKNKINIEKVKIYEINKKYRFLDEVFLRVLKKYPEKMPNIFFKIFGNSYIAAIKFLSNKSNIFEDLLIILKMPKWIFIKSIFN